MSIPCPVESLLWSWWYCPLNTIISFTQSFTLKFDHFYYFRITILCLPLTLQKVNKLTNTYIIHFCFLDLMYGDTNWRAPPFSGKRRSLIGSCMRTAHIHTLKGGGTGMHSAHTYQQVTLFFATERGRPSRAPFKCATSLCIIKGRVPIGSPQGMKPLRYFSACAPTISTVLWVVWCIRPCWTRGEVMRTTAVSRVLMPIGKQLLEEDTCKLQFDLFWCLRHLQLGS